MLTFVSYSRQNETFVLRLVQDLRENNVPIWLDQLDIPTGQRWDVAIEEALSNASHFLLVLSDFSSNSENVRDELDFAIDKGKIIIPILIDECDPPLRVRRLQRINFQINYQDALERLLAILPKDKINNLVNDVPNISGQWIRELDNCILFIKQRGNIVVGLYDRGEKYKLGGYFGKIEHGTLNHYWKWFHEEPHGSGELHISSDQKTLEGSWWYSHEHEKAGVHNKFLYFSDVMPSWLNEEDFSEYKDFLNGKKTAI